MRFDFQFQVKVVVPGEICPSRWLRWLNILVAARRITTGTLPKNVLYFSARWIITLFDKGYIFQEYEVYAGARKFQSFFAHPSSAFLRAKDFAQLSRTDGDRGDVNISFELRSQPKKLNRHASIEIPTMHKNGAKETERRKEYRGASTGT